MNWKAYGVLVGLLALIGIGAVLFIKPERNRVGTTAGRVFPHLQQRDLVSIEVQLHTGDHSPLTVAANRTPDGWALTQPVSDLADLQAVEAIVNDVVKLGYMRRLTEGVDPAHGFDPPAITIRAGHADGSVVEVLLGAKASLESHVYARASGWADTDVFVVPSDIVDHCRKAPWYWRNKRVMGVLPPDAMRVELAFPASPEPVVLQRQGNGQWRQTAPIADRADLEVVMEFLSRLHLEVQARRFVDGAEGEPPKLADHGLDAPFLRVQVTGSDGRHPEVVSFGTARSEFDGKPIPGLFAYRHRDQRIVECPPEHLEPLRQAANVNYFRAQAVLEVPLAGLDRITVTPPGGDAWELAREANVWSLTKPRPLKCMPQRPEVLLAQLPELRAVAFVDGLDETGLTARGLDTTSATRLELGAGDQADVVWVGNLDESGQRRFVRRDADGQVVLIKAAPLDMLLGSGRGWLSVIERKVWDVGVTQDQVSMRITVREDGATHDATWTRSQAPGGVVTWSAGTGAPPVAASVASTDVEGVCSGLTTLFADQWRADATRPGALSAAGLAEPAGDDGWWLRIELTRQPPGKPADTATLWIGNSFQLAEVPGPNGARRLFRASPKHALQGDLVGSLRAEIADRCAALVR